MFGLPAAAQSVGNQSRPEMRPFSIVPGLMWPGQRAMHGTRKPPSNAVPFCPLNGVLPPSGHVNVSAPLSVLKTTIVLSASPMSSKCFNRSPTQSSSCFIPASSVPKLVLLFIIFAYFCDRNVQTCIRVVLCQRKNGLPAFFASSMNRLEFSTSTSSNVVMSYLCFTPIGCMFGTLVMSGYGGIGPSSTIRCLPILPQRGISVASSLSVAQQWTRLRGPYLSRNAWSSGYENQYGSDIASRWYR